MASSGGKANELTFQNEIIHDLQTSGYKKGDPQHYNRVLALYPKDALTFVQETQADEWQKYQKLYPNNAEDTF